MVSARLAQIQDNLSHLYEQLGSKEKALIQADEEEKTRIEQEIWEIKKKIQRDEKELEGLGLKQDATGTKSKFVISLWPPKIEWTIEGEQNIQDVKKFLQENSQKFLQSYEAASQKDGGGGAIIFADGAIWRLRAAAGVAESGDRGVGLAPKDGEDFGSRV